MKIGEMIGLAVSGYTASDIKELAEMQKENPDIIKLTKTGAKMSDIKDLLAMADSEETPENNAGQEPDKSDPTPDYRKMYEDQKAELEKLERTVSEIQKKNASEDISGSADGKDPLADFMNKL